MSDVNVTELSQDTSDNPNACKKCRHDLTGEPTKNETYEEIKPSEDTRHAEDVEGQTVITHCETQPLPDEEEEGETKTVESVPPEEETKIVESVSPEEEETKIVESVSPEEETQTV